MFLNLTSPKQILSQQNYLSSIHSSHLNYQIDKSNLYSPINHLNLNLHSKYKGKSYSTSSLKEQFQQYKYRNGLLNHQKLTDGGKVNISLCNSRFKGGQCRHRSSLGNLGRANSSGQIYAQNNRSSQEQKSNLNKGSEYATLNFGQKARFYPNNNSKQQKGLKSYLNLDSNKAMNINRNSNNTNVNSKLNKCTITNSNHKDYFKPSLHQSPNQFVEMNNKRQQLKISHFNNNKTNQPLNSKQQSYSYANQLSHERERQIKKQIKRQNQINEINERAREINRQIQRQVYNNRIQEEILMSELMKLKQENLMVIKLQEEYKLIKIENQELRKQRNIDLELIARQNQVIKGQEDLMIKNQTKLKSALIMNSKVYDNGTAYSFNQKQSSNLLESSRLNYNLQCPDCNHRRTQQSVQHQFSSLRMQKIEEQKRLMRKQIHELVYANEKLKENLKKAEQKYHKELEHNQKLIKIIQSQNNKIINGDQQANSIKIKPNSISVSKKEGLHEKSYFHNQNNNHSQKKLTTYINILNEQNINEPISIKKETQKYLNQRKNMTINVNGSSIANNLNHNKSAASLLRYTKQNEEQQVQNSKFSSQKKRQNLEWCENQGIKKYLQEINKQKIQEIDEIQNLLRFE